MYAHIKKVLFFILVLFLASGCKESVRQHCLFELLKVSQSGNTLDVMIRLDKQSCKGVFIDFDIKDKRYSFFANIDNKLLKAAPPYGFSASLNKDKCVSLGVDKNIREININGVSLLDSSRIKDTHEGMLVDFKLKLPENVAYVDIHALKGKVKRIYFKRYDECKQVYLSLLSTPDVFEKPQINYTIPTLSSFMSVCLAQKSEKDKKRLLVKTFHIEKGMIESLKQSGKTTLANFIKRKIKHKKIKPGKQCSVTVKLINAVTLKPVNDRRLKIFLQKISKEECKGGFNTLKFHINKGVYILTAISNRFHGESKPINCRGGYIYVVIPLEPSI